MYRQGTFVSYKKDMKKQLSELVFILDKSGSMAGKEEDTIGSFNSTIKEHKKKENKVLVTTVLFSDDNKIIHDRIDIKEVELLNNKQYYVGGCTALVDAMGETIEHIKGIHKYQKKEDIPAHTMFIIITDGLENASHKFSSDDVKKLVEQQKETGWEFLFMGANIDAVETAKQFSIDESRAVNFINDKQGIKKAHNLGAKMSDCLFNKRISEKIDVCEMMDLRQEVDEDYNKRKAH